MRVLFVSPTGALGGAERVLLSILESLRKARPELQCHLLSLSAGPLIDRAADLGVKTLVLPAPQSLTAFGDSQQASNRLIRALRVIGKAVPLAWSTWKYVRQLRRRVKEIAPDVIHSNGIKTHALLWLVRTRQIPLVWHIHDFLSRRPLARRLLSLAVRKVTCVIAISEAVARDLRGLWPKILVQVVANGVDVRYFYPQTVEPAILDRLAGLVPSPCLRVGLVATYARWKGHDVFLAAAAHLVRNRPDSAVRFYIVGGPIYQTQGSQWSREDLTRIAEKEKIAPRVGFIEFQSDVRPIYLSLDVVIHASTAPEPFGLTIVEAMACGKPVIVTQGGGVSEFIRHGVDALSVSPNESAALAAAIASLMDDSALRFRLGSNARATVCQRYDLDRFGNEIVAIFDRFNPQTHEKAAAGDRFCGRNKASLHPENF